MNQNKRKIIGLTGGIASGKSTVSNIIKSIGYKVIDADIISRKVVEKGKPAYLKVVEYFGVGILDEEDKINRTKLGNIVFNDRFKREKLNSIVHPYILKEIKNEIDNTKEDRVVFVDIPLLIEVLDDLKENGIHFDEIWIVYVDEETQIRRLTERDSINREDAIRRIKAQMSMDVKIKYADRIIDNRGDKKKLENTVLKMLKEVV